MDFVPLTPEQKNQFQTDGFLIVRNVLDKPTIDRLIAAGDRLIASDIQENRQKNNDGYDSFRNVVAMDDAFVPLITQPKILPLVVQLMSPNLALLTSHLIYKYPEKPGTPPTRRDPGWHRDIANTPKDLGEANIPLLDIKAAYYLTDLSEPKSGVTLFSPGTHHLKERLRIPDGQPDPDNVVEPLLKPGDCVLFENRTWHAGGVNFSGRLRKAVMIGYTYQWMRPTDYVIMPDRVSSQLDDIGKQLVGALKDPQGRYVVGGINKPLVDWWKANGLTGW
jgi:ectoine hydroxylase-related dioxygenase (phytanoyl-CoA dioxygenase family)